ncbi:hypothetical protein HPB49_003617 [Dermacentor silvarum]|uniref:Uncharacterized protein n=1 Tax=Dermacentor silvarum TaxID=543639 RepID=A0ACB8CPK2_DERSI|nr:hypothetical protein HPB49_003617 [Dermacentor silvarum]
MPKDEPPRCAVCGLQRAPNAVLLPFPDRRQSKLYGAWLDFVRGCPGKDNWLPDSRTGFVCTLHFTCSYGEEAPCRVRCHVHASTNTKHCQMPDMYDTNQLPVKTGQGCSHAWDRKPDNCPTMSGYSTSSVDLPMPHLKQEQSNRIALASGSSSTSSTSTTVVAKVALSLYEEAASLEHALLNLDVGFTLNFSFDSTPTTWTIPGLVFADDLVLLAENEAQLQQLVETSAKHLGTLGLAFNSRKSAVVQFSGDRENPTMVLPDGERLPTAEEYRYLGVVLSASDGVNAEHEAHLRQSAQRASRILRRQCLWGCSRYLMVRELWKAVHVPGLTFANSTICLTAPTRDWLERGQREVGRLALGCHGRVAVEAIQGDVGWSSFEAREAKSKIAFECRLRNMDDGRWARRVFRYVYLKGIQTQCRARVQFLRRKYGLLNYPETGGARCETAKGVQDHVRETERELWKSAMASKTTLRLYCDNKGTITPEPIYDNSGGSALLFEARAGALRTLDYRSRFDCAPEVQAAVCRVCGSERETAEHLVLNCAKLSPTPKEGTTMPQALGFLDAEGGRCFEGVATTKARLERWWRAVKQSRTVPGVT